MIKKTLLVLTVLFAVEFLASCDRCDCGSIYKQISYEGMNLKTLDLSGFNEVEATEFEYAKEIGIIVNLEIEITRLEAPISLNFGFNSAYSCDCPGIEYFFNDYIQNIKITEVNGSTETDLTNAFMVSNYDLLDIDDYLNEFARKKESNTFFNEIRLELIDDSQITQQAQFRIEIILQSGEVLFANTELLSISQI